MELYGDNTACALWKLLLGKNVGEKQKKNIQIHIKIHLLMMTLKEFWDKITKTSVETKIFIKIKSSSTPPC